MDREKIHVNVSKEIKDKLSVEAKERGITISELIRFILADYLTFYAIDRPYVKMIKGDK